MNASLSLIDVCLPCYLTDHHNRDGELLFGLPVDGATRYAQIRDDLCSEFNMSDTEHCPVEGEAFMAALQDCFAAANPDDAFDPSLEINSENDWDEPVMAWFLLTWEV